MIRAAPVAGLVCALLGAAVGYTVTAARLGDQIASANQDRDLLRDELSKRSSLPSDATESQFIKTSLGLRFFGDGRMPKSLHSENVLNWYTMYSNSALLETTDPKTNNKVTLLAVPKNWFIFVVFERPISAGELRAEFSAPGLPSTTVYNVGRNSLAVTVSGDPPASDLEIYATPP